MEYERVRTEGLDFKKVGFKKLKEKKNDVEDNVQGNLYIFKKCSKHNNKTRNV